MNSRLILKAFCLVLKIPNIAVEKRIFDSRPSSQMSSSQSNDIKQQVYACTYLDSNHRRNTSNRVTLK